MRISSIAVDTLYFEYPAGRSITTPLGPVVGRLTNIISVTTDDGRIGIGSAYAHPAMVKAVVEQLSPLLIGRNLDGDTKDRIGKLWQAMSIWTKWSGRKGAALTTIGGIDIALWDLYGQATLQPIWRLLGAKQSRCPAYASGLLYSSPDEVAQKAADLVALGFRRMKMRIGLNWDYDLAAIRAVRAAIGPKIDLMVDGTQRFDLPTAQAMAQRLAQDNIFWFEEPFGPEAIDDFTALTATSPVPVATGENEFGFEGFRELVRAKAANIIQADASRSGGISEVYKTAAMAHSAGLGFAPHSWCDPVAVIANAHIVLAAANGITVEVDQTGNQFISDLLVQPLRVQDGMLDLGSRPGLGIELDQTALARFRIDPSNLPVGNHCDLLIGGRSIIAPVPAYGPVPA